MEEWWVGAQWNRNWMSLPGFLVVKKDKSIQKFPPRERNSINREFLGVEGRGRGYSSKEKVEGKGAKVIYRGIIANIRQESGEVNCISPDQWTRRQQSGPPTATPTSDTNAILFIQALSVYLLPNSLKAIPPGNAKTSPSSLFTTTAR